MTKLTFAPVSLNSKSRVPLALGPDLRQFLFSAAQQRRQELKTRLASVTGSAGKTTVKEMLGSILNTWSAKKSLPTHLSKANQNTKMALARQILSVSENTAFAVFEVGARRQGDFEIPFSYLKPQVVTLLNVGSAHAGEFGSVENLVAEKLSVLEFPTTETHVVCADDPRILNHAQKQSPKIFSFGYSEKSDLRIVSDDSEGVRLKLNSETFWLPSNYIGPQKALNLAAAFATAWALGFEVQDILGGLKNFKGVERRFQFFTWQGRKAIDDAFNASPESMQEGLQLVSSISQGKQVLLVIGSMLELGPYAEKAHRNLGDFILRTFKTPLPMLVTIGTEAQFIHESLRAHIPSRNLWHFASSSEAKSPIENLAESADIIYFKGSKSLQLKTIFS